MSRPQFLLLLFISKLLCGLIAWYVIGSVTKLGDTQDYLSGFYLNRNNPLSTAYLMSLSGSIFSKIVGYNFLANLPLLLLSWFSLVIVTKDLCMKKVHWLFLFLLFLSPSYQIWTSIHSKEAIINFFFSLYLIAIIKSWLGKRISKTVLILSFMGFFLVVFFKPLYAPSLLWLAFFTAFIAKRKQIVLSSMITTLFAIVCSILIILLTYKLLDPVIKVFHLHFSADGDFSRPSHKWDSVSDMLYKIPGGMIIAFIGPKLSEALKVKIMLPFFIEGVSTLFIILTLLFNSTIKNGRILFLRLSMLLGFIALLLIGHYPQGYFNPGSAIRYKEAFYPTILVVLFFFSFDNRLKIKS